MKNNFVHLVFTSFTGRGIPGWKGQAWLDRRIKIFKEYTLQSLINQTNRNFVHWVSWRAQEKRNTSVKKLGEYLTARNYPFVFTFGGLPIWDDRKSNERIELRERLQKTLLDLIPILGEAKYCYQSILDSDDMLDKNAVQTVQNQTYGRKKAIGWTKGYVYNIETGQLAHWNTSTVPPFYTIMFPTDIFKDPEKHYNYIGPFRSHECVVHYFKFKNLSGRKFCVNVHGKNYTTAWDHPFRGKEITKNKNNILSRFGI